MPWPSNVSSGDVLSASIVNGIIDEGVRKDADNNLGAHFVDLEEIAEPVAPTVKRRIFVNSADGELSIRKDDGTTRSLESASGNTITRGAAASRPVSASVAGDLYIHSDEPYYSLWNGSSWVLLLRGGQWAVTEPAAGGWLNQSDANLNTNFGGIRIDIPPRAVAAFSGQGYGYIGPAAVSTVIALTARGSTAAQLIGGGVFFHEVASDKILAMTIGPAASGANVLAITRWHAPTGMPEFVQQEFLTITGEFVWMRQQDDSTDVIFEISRDGNLFEEVYREARGSLFSVAPDRAGLGGFTMGGAGNVDLHVLHRA